jgi:uncharacterized membrane protein
MAQGIGEVLTFAIGVAISPVSIIAVILMLFSGRAKVNGPMFLAGWVVALAVVSGAAYLLSDADDAPADSAAAGGVSWAQIVFGVLFLLLAGRSWRSRPARELRACLRTCLPPAGTCLDLPGQGAACR